MLLKILKIISPLAALGVFGCFFPWVYTVIPVSRSGICLCNFYTLQAIGNRSFWFLNDSYLPTMQLVNQLSIYLVNFAFLFALVFMVHKIRHINDNTQIRNECTVVVAWWIFIQSAHFVSFAMTLRHSCNIEYNIYSQKASTFALTVSYWAAVTRQLVTVLITMRYQLLVNRQEANLM